MSAAQLTLGSPRLLLARSDRGLSDEAHRLRALLDDALDFTPSMALGEAFRQTVAALQEAYDAASSENWDGYGAQAVDPSTFAHARSFLRALPTTVPQPEVSVHPDGEIAFEWDLGPRLVLTASINGEGYLSYAGLFGRNKVHGVEYFVEELPEAIAHNLRRLLANADATAA